MKRRVAMLWVCGGLATSFLGFLWLWGNVKDMAIGKQLVIAILVGGGISSLSLGLAESFSNKHNGGHVG